MKAKTKQHHYRVVEKVTFEYVYLVEAASKADAENVCDSVGDGEAMEHNEVGRRFIRVEEVGDDEVIAHDEAGRRFIKAE